ncbi:MAG TPA: chlorite dismutase family protein [Thermoleophilaceae bacterium]|nr:chlorite dismutase family protein [Thermoleophilaceae bacterium]
MTEARNYVKYTFLKVDPAWRRRSPDERAADKQEFAAACTAFGEDHYLRAYSLVGTRGDCDLMVRAIARRLDPIHELHVLLNQSGLLRFAEVAHSYLAMTKESPYSDQPDQPLAPREGADSKYLVVYPMWKKREWYGLSPDERMRVMRDHIAVARRFTGIETNTAYSFGLDDQEFVVAFDVDDPAEFLDLVQELRSTESSTYTESETPIFTCIAASLQRALDALDGERAAPASRGSPGERAAPASVRSPGERAAPASAASPELRARA